MLPLAGAARAPQTGRQTRWHWLVPVHERHAWPSGHSLLRTHPCAVPQAVPPAQATPPSAVGAQVLAPFPHELVPQGVPQVPLAAQTPSTQTLRAAHL